MLDRKVAEIEAGDYNTVMAIAAWQIETLVELVRQRYPEWDGFHHAPFVQDELTPKRSLQERFAQLLSKGVLQELLSQQAFAEIVRRVEKIGRSTSLLYNRTPKQGDLNILYQDNLQKGEFCHYLFRLLHGAQPLEQRVHRYTAYVKQALLPNKWAFPTFFLALQLPSEALFIKPQVGQWFLRYWGMGQAWTQEFHPRSYQVINQVGLQLLEQLTTWGATDLIDVQSIVWVAHRESRSEASRLQPQAQIALDQPPTEYEHVTPTLAIAEESAEYSTNLPQTDAPMLQPQFSIEQVAQKTLHDEALIQQWIAAIERKQQAIFYGPPGTGKTFVAQAIAQHLVGGGAGFWELLQLHPNYAYEDFVLGLRPVERDGQLIFESVPGRFLDFCQRAEAAGSDRCVLILDEVNRADLARVFGELMYLLEYRGQEIALAGGKTFSIPQNVRVLGTMNTADRSIALVDYALRRRFAFIALQPNFDVLRRFHAQSDFPIEALIEVLQRINSELEPEYQLGMSYFLTRDLPDQLPNIWQMEIEPYLEEYFYTGQATPLDFRWDNICAKVVRT